MPKKEYLTYQGQGRGVYGMARLLASKKVVAAVFVSITPGPMDILKQAGLIDSAVPVASTRMVIAYNLKGKFAPALAAAKDGKADAKPWWKALQSPGLRFGRTDLVSDPQGQNIVLRCCWRKIIIISSVWRTVPSATCKTRNRCLPDPAGSQTGGRGFWL